MLNYSRIHQSINVFYVQFHFFKRDLFLKQLEYMNIRHLQIDREETKQYKLAVKWIVQKVKLTDSYIQQRQWARVAE